MAVWEVSGFIEEASTPANHLLEQQFDRVAQVVDDWVDEQILAVAVRPHNGKQCLGTFAEACGIQSKIMAEVDAGSIRHSRDRGRLPRESLCHARRVQAPCSQETQDSLEPAATSLTTLTPLRMVGQLAGWSCRASAELAGAPSLPCSAIVVGGRPAWGGQCRGTSFASALVGRNARCRA